jgi:hypothetical protein
MTRRRVLAGTVLVAVGIIIWIDRIGGTHEAHAALHFLRRWAAIGVIIIGAVNLAAFLKLRWWVVGPLLVMGAGAAWQILRLHDQPLQLSRFVLPSVLITVGLVLALAGPEADPDEASTRDSGRLRRWAVLRGKRVQSKIENLQQAHAGALLGHLELDLRHSTLYEGYGELAVTAICGHIQLVVPPEWDVELQPSVGFRAKAHDRKPISDAQSSSEESPFLKVHVLGLLGSAEVRLA